MTSQPLGRRASAWSAPGRVNLIGEHTDYNDGYVLPFAIGLRTTVTAQVHEAPLWTVRSAQQDAPVSFGASDLQPGRVGGWAGYVAAVVWTLRDAGVPVPFADIDIRSELPLGAGLSSSAALECAALAALLDLAGVDLPRREWPGLARRAENVYLGVPSGLLDQSAVVRCRAGHALFLDCRSGDAEDVRFDLAGAGLTMLVIDTHIPHEHATGEYAVRQASCVAAAAALGVPALRDVTDLDAALSTLDDEVIRRRTRHVVTENQRVLDTVDLLHRGCTAEIGPLLTASHVSLRDDYEVSSAELDLAVEAALAAGALGARMTGGGFGGCAIALVPADAAVRVTDAVAGAFAGNGRPAPTVFVATAADGVRRVGWIGLCGQPGWVGQAG